ncbi:MAG: hypothetical protein V4857_14250 [Pseudomonadota bacterium]
MQPNDYSGAFSNLPQPSEALMDGFKNGAAIRQMQQQEAAKQAAAAQAAQMNEDLYALSQNPTTAGISQMSLRYPQLSESFKRTFDMMEPAQKQAKLELATQVYSALEHDEPTIAYDLLMKQAAGHRNAGNEEEAKASEAQATMVKDHTKFAKLSAGKMLSAAMGADKFATTFGKLGEEQRAEAEAPGKLMKTNADGEAAVADAGKKKTEAKYAEKGILLDLERKGWDIKKIKADIDIARESNRIAAMNAAASRDGNSLKKQELQLKISDAISARDDKVREKISKAESGITAMDNMMNTVERLKKNPALRDVIGSMEGSDWYPTNIVAGMTALNPLTTGSDARADAKALIETLKSQAFLSQVPTIQGMGSLSNAEGAKLEQGLQNLGRQQSEKQFGDNLDEILRLVNKGRANVAKKYGAPARAPDTPAAPGGTASPSASAPAPAPAAAGWSVVEVQ